METTKCPATEDWEGRCGTIHNGTLLSRKKRQNTVIVTTWRDLENIMLSK